MSLLTSTLTGGTAAATNRAQGALPDPSSIASA
jgi:hypothetical protein